MLAYSFVLFLYPSNDHVIYAMTTLCPFHMGINSYASWKRLENLKLLSVASVVSKLLGCINSTESVTSSGDVLSSKYFLTVSFI